MAAVPADYRPRPTRSEQNTAAAFVLALGMHALLVAALWLSVQWRTEPAGAVIVELWGAPPPEPVIVAPPPPPIERPAPEPEKPDAEIVVKQEKKAPPPDLQKIEAEKRRAEAEKKRLEAEKKQLELERKKQAEAMAAAAERRREEERREAVRKAEQARMLAQAGAGTGGGTGAPGAAGAGGRGDPSYAAQLIAVIRPRIVYAVPEGTSPNVYAEFQVDLLPTGEILAVRKLRPSGLAGYDEAVERAIRRTDPFPRQRDGSVDRSVIIRFRPVDAQ